MDRDGKSGGVSGDEALKGELVLSSGSMGGEGAIVDL
jgi:hypothetical protein